MNRYNRQPQHSFVTIPVRIFFTIIIALAILTPQARVVSSYPPQENQPEIVPGRVIIKLRDQVEPQLELEASSMDAAMQLLAREEILSAEELYSEPAAFQELARLAGLEDVYVIELQEGVDVFQFAEALAADPDVEYAEPDYVLRTAIIPNDNFFNQQWGLNNTGQAISTSSAGRPDADIDIPEAWDISRGSRDTIIAIIDTGVDLAHPDLISKLITGATFTLPDGLPQDDGGHGTHVAGIAAAATNNNTTGVAGVCWECRIMPLKAMSKTTGSTSTVSSAIRYAVDHGAHVINLSLGGPDGNTTLHNAVRYAYLANVPIVAAMMNEAESHPSTIYYPAAYSETIAVGSTDKMDIRSSFSSYGGHIDLTAPGSEILNTYWVEVEPNQHTYAYLWGTSMAAPHVAGVIGLMRSVAPHIGIEEIRTIIKTSADDLGDPGWDIFYGAGRVNAKQALKLTPKEITSLSISGPIFIKPGQTISFTARVGPSIADTPITYSWESSEQSIQTATTDNLTYQATYSWSSSGKKTIKVTVANTVSTQISTKTIYVGDPIFLPAIRNKK
jgi:subtilisin family serine protease